MLFRAQELGITVGQARGPKFLIQEDVAGPPRRNFLALAGHCVVELDEAAVGVGDRGSDVDILAVFGTTEVAAAGFCDRQQDAVSLHLAVREAGGFAEFGASNFHPDQVVCVVHHAHLVSFGIADSNAAGVCGDPQERPPN